MCSFDNIDPELLLRAVRKHAKDSWVVLYISRWLTAPAQDEEGRLTERGKGTPQGGVISPLLANLFLHYALDVWMRNKYPQWPFERYADDAIVHCRTEMEAREVRAAIAARMEECRWELHPVKTKIVYCKDDDRRRRYPNEKFDFWGYGFQPRRSKNRFGKYFINFSPAISDQAGKSIREEIRSWNPHLRSDKAIEDLSRMCNPKIRGWLQFYGRYYRSALYPLCVNWTARWPIGRIENTKSCAVIYGGRRIGSRAFHGAIRNCSPTGRWACGVVPWREPYELRGSSTVLREPRGEIPRGYSPRDSQPR